MCKANERKNARSSVHAGLDPTTKSEFDDDDEPLDLRLFLSLGGTDRWTRWVPGLWDAEWFPILKKIPKGFGNQQGAGTVAMSRSQFASPHQQQGGYHPPAVGFAKPEQTPFGGALFARSTATPMPPAEHTGGQVCLRLSSIPSDAKSHHCSHRESHAPVPLSRA